jgi:hypothetical protein
MVAWPMNFSTERSGCEAQDGHPKAERPHDWLVEDCIGINPITGRQRDKTGRATKKRGRAPEPDCGLSFTGPASLRM